MSTTVSSREFNQNISAAKRAANAGPVIITDRGRPAHVLLSIEHYRYLTGARGDIVQLLAMPEDIDFEPASLQSVGLAIPDLG